MAGRARQQAPGSPQGRAKGSGAALDAKALQRARQAFEAAADEAGILMPEPPKSEARAGSKTPDWNRPRKPLKRDR